MDCDENFNGCYFNWLKKTIFLKFYNYYKMITK